jgi:hypothetical protein
MMVVTRQRQAQKERVWKAKVALALYSEYGKVPNERVIDKVYHLTRVLVKTVLGTPILHKQQRQSGQLVLFCF